MPCRSQNDSRHVIEQTPRTNFAEINRTRRVLAFASFTYIHNHSSDMDGRNANQTQTTSIYWGNIFWTWCRWRSEFMAHASSCAGWDGIHWSIDASRELIRKRMFFLFRLNPILSVCTSVSEDHLTFSNGLRFDFDFYSSRLARNRTQIMLVRFQSISTRFDGRTCMSALDSTRFTYNTRWFFAKSSANWRVADSRIELEQIKGESK